MLSKGIAVALILAVTAAAPGPGCYRALAAGLAKTASSSRARLPGAGGLAPIPTARGAGHLPGALPYNERRPGNASIPAPPGGRPADIQADEFAVRLTAPQAPPESPIPSPVRKSPSRPGNVPASTEAGPARSAGRPLPQSPARDGPEGAPALRSASRDAAEALRTGPAEQEGLLLRWYDGLLGRTSSRRRWPSTQERSETAVAARETAAGASRPARGGSLLKAPKGEPPRPRSESAPARPSEIRESVRKRARSGLAITSALNAGLISAATAGAAALWLGLGLPLWIGLASAAPVAFYARGMSQGGRLSQILLRNNELKALESGGVKMDPSKPEHRAFFSELAKMAAAFGVEPPAVYLAPRVSTGHARVLSNPGGKSSVLLLDQELLRHPQRAAVLAHEMQHIRDMGGLWTLYRTLPMLFVFWTAAWTAALAAARLMFGAHPDWAWADAARTAVQLGIGVVAAAAMQKAANTLMELRADLGAVARTGHWRALTEALGRTAGSGASRLTRLRFMVLDWLRANMGNRGLAFDQDAAPAVPSAAANAPLAAPSGPDASATRPTAAAPDGLAYYHAEPEWAGRLSLDPEESFGSPEDHRRYREELKRLRPLARWMARVYTRLKEDKIFRPPNLLTIQDLVNWAGFIRKFESMGGSKPWTLKDAALEGASSMFELALPERPYEGRDLRSEFGRKLDELKPALDLLSIPEHLGKIEPKPRETAARREEPVSILDEEPSLFAADELDLNEPPDLVLTETVRKRLIDLIMLYSREHGKKLFPLIIGPTAEGKSSLVKFMFANDASSVHAGAAVHFGLKRALGRAVPVVAIPVKEAMTRRELMGGKGAGGIELGFFSLAAQHGWVLVLEEINQASGEFKKTLNKALHQVRKFGYFEFEAGGRTVRIQAHPDFWLVGTENPEEGNYAFSRNPDPPDFVKRFVSRYYDFLPSVEQAGILSGLARRWMGDDFARRYGLNQAFFEKLVVDFHEPVRTLVDAGRFGDGRQEPYEFNRRTLLRWLKRYLHDLKLAESSGGGPPDGKTRRLLLARELMEAYGSEMRFEAEKDSLWDKMNVVFELQSRHGIVRRDLAIEVRSFRQKGGKLIVDEKLVPLEIPLREDGGSRVPGPEHRLTLVPNIAASVYRSLRNRQFREHQFSTGPTGTAKTSEVFFVNHMLQEPLFDISMDEQTPMSEFHGGFVKDPGTGEFRFKPGIVARAMMYDPGGLLRPGPDGKKPMKPSEARKSPHIGATLLIDEANANTMIETINPALDDGVLHLSDGRHAAVAGAGAHFVMAMNPAGEGYAGYPMTGAIKSRAQTTYHPGELSEDELAEILLDQLTGFTRHLLREKETRPGPKAAGTKLSSPALLAVLGAWSAAASWIGGIPLGFASSPSRGPARKRPHQKRDQGTPPSLATKGPAGEAPPAQDGPMAPADSIWKSLEGWLVETLGLKPEPGFPEAFKRETAEFFRRHPDKPLAEGLAGAFSKTRSLTPETRRRVEDMLAGRALLEYPTDRPVQGGLFHEGALYVWTEDSIYSLRDGAWTRELKGIGSVNLVELLDGQIHVGANKGVYVRGKGAWTRLPFPEVRGMARLNGVLHASNSYRVASWTAAGWRTVWSADFRTAPDGRRPYVHYIRAYDGALLVFTNRGLYARRSGRWKRELEDFFYSGVFHLNATTYVSSQGSGLYAWERGAWRKQTRHRPFRMVESGGKLYAAALDVDDGFLAEKSGRWSLSRTPFPSSGHGLADIGGKLHVREARGGWQRLENGSWKPVPAPPGTTVLMPAGGALCFGGEGGLSLSRPLPNALPRDWRELLLEDIGRAVGTRQKARDEESSSPPGLPKSTGDHAPGKGIERSDGRPIFSGLQGAFPTFLGLVGSGVLEMPPRLRRWLGGTGLGFHEESGAETKQTTGPSMDPAATQKPDDPSWTVLERWIATAIGDGESRGGVRAWRRAAAELLREQPRLSLESALAETYARTHGLGTEFAGKTESLLSRQIVLQHPAREAMREFFRSSDGTIYARTTTQLYGMHDGRWRREELHTGAIYQIGEMDGEVLVACDGGLFTLRNGRWTHEIPGGKITGFAKLGRRLYASGAGTLAYREDGAWLGEIVPDLKSAGHLWSHDNVLYLSTRDGLHVKRSGRWSWELRNVPILHAYLLDGRICVRSGLKLYQWAAVEWQQMRLPVDFLYSNVLSFGGKLHLGADGVYAVENGLWVRDLPEANVERLFRLGDDELYASTNLGHYKLEQGRWRRVYPARHVRDMLRVEGNLLLATEEGIAVDHAPPAGLPGDWRERVMGDIAESIRAAQRDPEQARRDGPAPAPPAFRRGIERGDGRSIFSRLQGAAPALRGLVGAVILDGLPRLARWFGGTGLGFSDAKRPPPNQAASAAPGPDSTPLEQQLDRLLRKYHVPASDRNLRKRLAEQAVARIRTDIALFTGNPDVQVRFGDWWTTIQDAEGSGFREITIPLEDIFVRAVDPKGVEEAVGAAVHEIAHYLLTRVDPRSPLVAKYALSDSPEEHQALYQAVEDSRINTWALLKRPGFKPYLDAVYEALWPEDHGQAVRLKRSRIQALSRSVLELEMPDKTRMFWKPPHLQFAESVLYHWRHGKLPPFLTDPRARDYFERSLDALKRIRDSHPEDIGGILLEAVKPKAWLDAMEILEREIYPLYRELIEGSRRELERMLKQGARPSSRKPGPAGGAGEGDGNDPPAGPGSSPSGRAGKLLRELSRKSAEGMHGHAHGRGRAEPSDPKRPDAAGRGEARGAGGGEDGGDSWRARHERAQAEARRFQDSLNGYEKYRLKAGELGLIDKVDGIVKKILLPSTHARMSRLHYHDGDEPDLDKYADDAAQGRLDTPVMRRWNRKARRTAKISLALDISGSMGSLSGKMESPLDYALTGIVAWIEVCQKNNIDFEIMLFDHAQHVVHPFGRTLDGGRKAALFVDIASKAGGSTAIGEALRRALERILKQPATHRFVIFATDEGHNTGRAPGAFAEKAGKSGVVTVAMVIGAGTGGYRHFDYAVRVKDAKDFPARLLEVLQQAIRAVMCSAGTTGTLGLAAAAAQPLLSSLLGGYLGALR